MHGAIQTCGFSHEKGPACSSFHANTTYRRSSACRLSAAVGRPESGRECAFGSPPPPPDVVILIEAQRMAVGLGVIQGLQL
eukprot:7387119-Prymnesium_polylepis.1